MRRARTLSTSATCDGRTAAFPPSRATTLLCFSSPYFFFTGGGSFVESDHLDGEVDMFRVVRTFAREAARRQRDGDAAALAFKSP